MLPIKQCLLFCVLVNIFYVKCQDIVFPGQVDSVLTRSISASTRNTLNGVTSFECSLPSGEPGDCIPYNNCRELQTLVAQTGLTRSTIQFLRSRLCAVRGSRFRLCCQKTVARISPVSGTTGSLNTNDLIPTEDECGVSAGTRITSGDRTKIGEHPWLVGLGAITNGAFQIQCGGSLITRRHVVTASHCFGPQSSPPITHVQLGEFNLVRNIEPEPPIVLQIARRTNPGYNPNTHLNDLELVELERDVNFSGYILPLCLPLNFREDNFDGQRMTIVGWGDTSFGANTFSDIPLKANVEVVDRASCNNAYRSIPVINIGNDRICASSQVFDACQGDSGGPIIYEGRRSYLIGVVSFGVNCANGTFPGVYTYLPAYLDWIQENL